MILVFIFLGIIIIISTIVLILLLSSIRIKIEDLNVINFKSDKKYKIFFQIYFIDKIKILSIKLNDKRINKITKGQRLKNLRLKSIKQRVELKDVLYILKNLKINIRGFDLETSIGIANAPITSYAVGIISGLIGVLLPKLTKSTNKNNIKYIINPIYNNNILKINLRTSIISLKIVHIILIIFSLVKKGRDKNERRASNRRSYVCSHGFN